MSYPKVEQSLYDARFEHDNCGVGFVANSNGAAERRVLDLALEGLCNLAHRGALDADAKTGDGAGVLIQLPRKFFAAEVEKLGGKLSDEADVAVGFVFLPTDEYKAHTCRHLVEEALEQFGIHKFGWRAVPQNPSCLGDKARNTMPGIEQVLLGRAADWSSEEYERRLYLARKAAEKKAVAQGIAEFYMPSFSSRTIIYKGLFNAPQLEKFYTDLQSPLFETTLCVFHQRYSTNTFPNWQLAQPFRMVAHNGEINTLIGNKNWTRARELELKSDLWGGNIEHLMPVLQSDVSDSACLDNALELLELSGRDNIHTAMMLAPEAWEKKKDLPRELEGFYKYHACLNEPWDGPAAIVFSNGTMVGATLDRNGLRPARFEIYEDGLVVMGSEIGLVDLPEGQVVRKGRLGPGKLIAIDTAEKKFYDDDDCKAHVAGLQPYADWCDAQLFSLAEHAKPFGESYDPVNILDLTLRQITCGWETEQITEILEPMVMNGAEPVGSMGDDTPLAAMSARPKLLHYYFKQLFAQVTNPPIDSIRERIVMSLNVYMGAKRSWLEETEAHAKQILLESPFLFEYELEALRNIDDPAFASETVACHFKQSDGAAGLDTALAAICEQAAEAVRGGKSILVLTDREVAADLVPIPMLLAVGAVHHHLIREGLRMKADMVCESGEAHDVHQFATLIGFGASAVCPYVAIDSIRENVESGDFDIQLDKGLSNFRKAIQNGILKIMSKMGISTLASYRGAQIFEAVGLSRAVVDRCFYGTTTQIEGVTLEQIAEDALRRHANAYDDPDVAELEEGGAFKPLSGGRGEFHSFNKPVVSSMHKFLRKPEEPDLFRNYTAKVEDRVPCSPRDLLDFADATPVPLEEVEPIENIRVRFTTAGMSCGALSPEAHECLAEAMNIIGGKSNSGEGGEDSARYGTKKNSAIKQIASGRFGVTPEYLASAEEIEIKMAQGAKPGEGGQLPGHKVSPMIAKLRFSVPGVPLISPPPHHDIYSIEDLAQLIYDLKQVNPRAKVCVKLVSCAGVGTVAAGVAKAYADVVLISGHDGGTGASPMSSIKYAGGPWEVGVADAHQTLMLNDLRSRIVVRTDGGIKTGRDIVTAALLGAEEFNFGTAALIAAGCAMFRVCHLNSCPVGVATQKEELRAKFRGKPESVVAFFNGVAEEVREWMAQLGFRKFDDMVGRCDLLARRPVESFPESVRDRVANIDLDKLVYQVDPSGTATRIHTRERNERFGDSSLDDEIAIDAKNALNGKGSVQLEYRIKNTHRNIGTRISGMIGFQYGNAGLPEGSIDLTLHGSAGQSLGTFLAPGIRMKVFGEANDYVCKGMHGGELIVRPPAEAKYEWAANQVVGNTCLYGATGGRFFAAGRAGERFCVRNSGATAVIEGVGDHGCEYMTGGQVVVLGSIGRNFGAGMSGGRAYIYDPENNVPENLNPAMVGLERLIDEDEIKAVQKLIYEHLELTESPRANEILKNWTDAAGQFWCVVPHPPEAKPAAKPVHELAEEKAKPAPTGGF
ncbi:MAG: glutamate synthase large subunit [Verrucomicrobiales bacterium]|nr:glutamate synthase large subunit [Verrucomicrobiales bacterium]|tara:strand:+ start:5762 stop:10300 length:4539 start_codon:yes stop_codon:yes gene_type:complete